MVFLVCLLVFLLVFVRTKPADNEEGDVDPEGVGKFGVNSVLNFFDYHGLTWIAPKYERPSTHENVRSDCRGKLNYNEIRLPESEEETCNCHDA